jgi:hypothetical protein
MEMLKQSNPNPPARNAYATTPSRQTRYAMPKYDARIPALTHAN